MGLRRSLWCPAFLRGGMRTAFEEGGNVSRDGRHLACWEEDAIRKHTVSRVYFIMQDTGVYNK